MMKRWVAPTSVFKEAVRPLLEQPPGAVPDSLFHSGHPGTREPGHAGARTVAEEERLCAPNQVQGVFLPDPWRPQPPMYHSGKTRCSAITRSKRGRADPECLKLRRLHKAFRRFNERQQTGPLLASGVRRMGLRPDLIGMRRRQLVSRGKSAGRTADAQARPGRGAPPRPVSARHHTGLSRRNNCSQWGGRLRPRG